jgi:uncharacterized repeat protein (TIGR03803 family)
MVFVGCGGSQPPIGPPGTMAQSRAIASANLIANRMTRSSYKVLYSFTGGSDGAYPRAGLLNIRGTLYGATSDYRQAFTCTDHRFCGTVYRLSATGAHKVLHRFHIGHVNAREPLATLIEAHGTFYGTTILGGSSKRGTVYAISTGGKVKYLHDFTGGSDGAYPVAPLVNVNGTLYGTTTSSGKGWGCNGGCGVVYSISTNGTEMVLHKFTGYPSDGSFPVGRLIDVNGTLYGTTKNGGSNGFGTVYSISTTGKESVLHSFNLSSSRSDGATPFAGLIDVNGTLYGTTFAGGQDYGGTVYSISTTGLEKVLYSFADGSDGYQPVAGLIAVNGMLYGTTEQGGGLGGCTPGGCGTVYRVSTTGKEQVLHRFGHGSDGEDPAADLIDSNGMLYGTTLRGGGGGCDQSGSSGCGTVFELSP